jgi:DNA-binding response OmpR family regulator
MMSNIGIIDVVEWQTVVDMRRGIPVDADGHLVEITRNVLKKQPYPGDLESESVSWVSTLTYQNQKIELTRNDYKILQLLMENIGKVVSREEIMQRLWENDNFVDDNTLTVNITRLRKKLAEAGLQNFIKTKKGLGYLVE